MGLRLLNINEHTFAGWWFQHVSTSLKNIGHRGSSAQIWLKIMLKICDFFLWNHESVWVVCLCMRLLSHVLSHVLSQACHASWKLQGRTIGWVANHGECHRRPRAYPNTTSSCNGLAKLWNVQCTKGTNHWTAGRSEWRSKALEPPIQVWDPFGSRAIAPQCFYTTRTISNLATNRRKISRTTAASLRPPINWFRLLRFAMRLHAWWTHLPLGFVPLNATITGYLREPKLCGCWLKYSRIMRGHKACGFCDDSSITNLWPSREIKWTWDLRVFPTEIQQLQKPCISKYRNETKQASFNAMPTQQTPCLRNINQLQARFGPNEFGSTHYL